MSKRILITGGAGFIAHHVVNKILSETDWEIVTLDRLDFSGNLNRLKEVVTTDSDYVNSVATSATAYLKSELYSNAKNKVEKLNSLLAKFPSVNGRRRLNSNEKYQELISFVTNTHRLPSANKNGEENLYQFFYKQRKLFDKNELDSKEENKFIIKK